MKFEGEYLNGRRKGKGKEYYDNGEIKFEGEYLYGYKRQGKHYLKNKLVAEGNYLFNKIWEGKLKKYVSKNDKLIFEGEYKNGKLNGKVKEYDEYSGRLIFEGEYLNGKKMEREKNIYLVNYVMKVNI